MVLAGGDAQGIVLELAALGGDGHGAFGGAPKTGHPFGDYIDLFENDIRDLIEQLVQGDEMRALHVPVRLFDLALQVDGVSQPIVQNYNDVTADFFRQIDLSFIHRRLLQISDSNRGYFALLASQTKKESDVGRGIHRHVLGEAERNAPATAQAAL